MNTDEKVPLIVSLAYLSDLLLTSFFLQVGHSLLPDLRAVMMHSAQNLNDNKFPILNDSIMF